MRQNRITLRFSSRFSRPIAIGLVTLLAAVLVARGVPSLGASGPAQPHPVVEDGYRITSDAVIRNCVTCHTLDAEGRMSRISFLRKTPEGWQASVRRMVSLHGVQLEPEAAREIVRYLATTQGLAPEELAPGAFEVERRMIEYTYPERDTDFACSACHSAGRVITQRRSADEWDLLIHTHRALYPLVDRQRFFNGGGTPADGKQPVEKALDHLKQTFPLASREWRAWSANLRSARVEGSWILSGHHPGRGSIFGTVEIRPVAGRDDEFTTEVRFVYADDGTEVRRAGQSIVYTGYQWRGRSAAGPRDELREVMSIERGWGQMSGRWFTGAHDEIGLDVTLRRSSGEAVIGGLHPRALRSGAGPQRVRVFGADLSASAMAGIDLGPGVRVLNVVSSEPGELVVQVEVTEDAAPGWRDASIGGTVLPDAMVVYGRVDRVRVTPGLGLARVGGVVVPKQFQQFEAIGYMNGPDGRPNTPDDLQIGPIPVTWSLEEFPATFDDDDVKFVGSIDRSGFFTPNQDGPNPERSGNRNNIGDVWVVATYRDGDSAPLTARAHLVVTTPNHMRWDEVPEP